MSYSLNYTKILLSASVIAFVATLVFGGTQAFFSDEEISNGNTFAAGAIDLQVDNSSYGFDWNRPGENNPTGIWGENPDNSWELSDLDDEIFFSFVDLKPGDYGEDTISLHVDFNDAYACMAFDVTATPENGQNEPEADVDPTTGENEGELQNYLSFLFWNDDGDNVLETGEEIIEDLSGLPGEIFTGEWLAIADGDDAPLVGDTVNYIGKGWCFGEMTATPVAPGDYGAPTADITGFSCDGSGDHNDAQTDGITVDVGFYAIQSRNNEGFLCSSLPALDGGEVDPEPERPEVGAEFVSYEAPAELECDETVELGESIQAAVAGASEGDTICVDPSYTGAGDTFPVNLTVTNLTVAGLGNAGDANIPGGFFVDANGVTVTGLEFTNYSFIASSENAAVYIHNEPGQGAGTNLTGTTISHNIFTAPGGAKAAEANGIVTEIGSASAIASGISVVNNTFADWRRGIFFNTANYEVELNTFTGNDVGIANDGPHSSSIHNNEFDGNVIEAVGVAPSAVGATTNDGSVTVNTNNFGPAGAGNDVNFYGASVDAGADVNATGNWWDGEAEGARTNDTAEVDTSSPEAVAYPLN